MAAPSSQDAQCSVTGVVAEGQQWNRHQMTPGLSMVVAAVNTWARVVMAVRGVVVDAGYCEGVAVIVISSGLSVRGHLPDVRSPGLG